MARIRTIKPEFPHSESMGRVSRDARLLFILMWTLADDAGRLRGSPRMLASLLFPYDTDVPALIESWLAELEREGCVRPYAEEGTHYMQIMHWAEHQRIDHPTPSKHPAPEGFASPRENSRVLAKIPVRKGREGIKEGTKERKGEEAVSRKLANPRETSTRAPRGARLPSDWQASAEELAWAATERPDLDAQLTAAEFRDYWTAKPGKDGVKLDWTATWRNWVRHERGHYARNGHAGPDIAHVTVPGRKGPDPALVKILADEKKAAPMPAEVRERLAAITTRGTP